MNQCSPCWKLVQHGTSIIVHLMRYITRIHNAQYTHTYMNDDPYLPCPQPQLATKNRKNPSLYLFRFVSSYLTGALTASGEAGANADTADAPNARAAIVRSGAMMIISRVVINSTWVKY